jgi:hypothetical protein
MGQDDSPSGTPAEEKGNCLGCLLGLVVLVALLALPALGVIYLLPSVNPNGVFPIVGMGAFMFWGLCVLGLTSGRLPSKWHSIERRTSPVAFYVGIALCGVLGFAFYILYLALLFGVGS